MMKEQQSSTLTNCIKAADEIYNFLNFSGITVTEHNNNSLVIPVNNKHFDALYVIVPISVNKFRSKSDVIYNPIIDIVLLKDNKFYYDNALGYEDAKRFINIYDFLREISNLMYM